MAFFVSPHGFGHAGRAAAVMEALQRRRPALRLELFTTLPAWFFEKSGCRGLRRHEALTDIGFVHRDAFVEDIPETVRRLEALVPFPVATVERLAADVRAAGCRAIVCDIAALGIAVARAAGIPSVLVENFTWGQLYPFYAAEHPGIERYAQYLGAIERSADFHVQTEPLCGTASSDLLAGPASRRPRTGAEAIRGALGIPPGRKLVLLTMGGTPGRHPFLEHLGDRPDVCFVAVGVGQAAGAAGRVICLPQDSPWYHPDLVHAADAVIGKAGYSTIAEVYAAGVPFGYVTRDRYPETPDLVAFIERAMPALHLDGDALASGRWLGRLDALLALPRVRRTEPNGADVIAGFLLDRCG
jgi:hypothetical protein